jgi:hypothetical protein
VIRVERAVTAALTGCAAELGACGPARWSFDLGNGTPLPATARREDGWLRFRTPLGSDPELPGWELLETNGRLPAPARIVRNPRTGRPELCADLWLDQDELPDRVAATCRALRQAAAALQGKLQAATATPPPADGTWMTLADELGWRVEQREGARFTVDLELPGLASQAWAEQQGAELGVWVDLARCGSFTSVSRRAASCFLLTTTCLLRMVRATVSAADAPALRLEIRLPAPLTAAELGLAFSALALACRHTSRELHALEVELAAEAFLKRVNNPKPKE